MNEQSINFMNWTQKFKNEVLLELSDAEKEIIPQCVGRDFDKYDDKQKAYVAFNYYLHGFPENKVIDSFVEDTNISELENDKAKILLLVLKKEKGFSLDDFIQFAGQEISDLDDFVIEYCNKFDESGFTNNMVNNLKISIYLYYLVKIFENNVLDSCENKEQIFSKESNDQQNKPVAFNCYLHDFPGNKDIYSFIADTDIPELEKARIFLTEHANRGFKEYNNLQKAYVAFNCYLHGLENKDIYSFIADTNIPELENDEAKILLLALKKENGFNVDNIIPFEGNKDGSVIIDSLDFKGGDKEDRILALQNLFNSCNNQTAESLSNNAKSLLNNTKISLALCDCILKMKQAESEIKSNFLDFGGFKSCFAQNSNPQKVEQAIRILLSKNFLESAIGIMECGWFPQSNNHFKINFSDNNLRIIGEVYPKYISRVCKYNELTNNSRGQDSGPNSQVEEKSEFKEESKNSDDMYGYSFIGSEEAVAESKKEKSNKFIIALLLGFTSLIVGYPIVAYLGFGIHIFNNIVEISNLSTKNSIIVGIYIAVLAIAFACLITFLLSRTNSCKFRKSVASPMPRGGVRPNTTNGLLPCIFRRQNTYTVTDDEINAGHRKESKQLNP